MASHQLAIAKASFSAGLLRPDPTSLSRENIEQFHSLLNTAIIQCTPSNVQKCKYWILDNIAQSTTRFTALGKYLTALTTSFVESGQPKSPSKREASIKRKRLHILYLLNDLLHHCKYRSNDASICGKIQPLLVNLFGNTASFSGCPKHQRKLLNLLDLWIEKGYYSKDYVEKLRETVKNASEAGTYTEGTIATGEKDQGLANKSAKLAPYVMPAMHGDSSTPWYDLPAGNLMPHIVPNSTRPINPDLIRPLQFVAGPADEKLVIAVKALLEDVQEIYGGEVDDEKKATWDIDELGQPIILDEITGDVLEGQGYYGWSRSFCEKMKRRRKGIDLHVTDARDRRSESRDSSPGIRKRQYSQSDDGSDHERYKPSRRRRSYSSSRTPSPARGRRKDGSRSRSSSYSRSPRRSRSPGAGTRLAEPRGFPPSREGFQLKPPMHSVPPPPFPPNYNQHVPPPPPPPPTQNMPYSGQVPPFGAWPPPPPQMMQNMQFNQNPGQWPPPPPPPPPGNPHMGYQQQQFGGYQPPAGPGSWQQQQQQQYQGNGRGYNGNGWNNGPRGGRGNYRGRGW